MKEDESSWETARDPRKKIKIDSSLGNGDEVWRIDQGLFPKCFSGVLEIGQIPSINTISQGLLQELGGKQESHQDPLGSLMKKYEDLKSEFLTKYMKNKGQYLPISLENQQLAKNLDWEDNESKSEDEKHFVETRSQSENSPTMEVESNDSTEAKDLMTGISIILPNENFEESYEPKKLPFIIIRDRPESPRRGRGRPRRKQSIIETEPFEMDKPYTIDLHIDSSKSTPEKIEKTPIGKGYQAEILPLSLNKSQRPAYRDLKPLWRPDILSEQQWADYLDKVSEIVGEKVTKEEAVAKHLKKWNYNIEKALEEIKKSKMTYRGHFRVCQTYLRNRSLNYQPKTLPLV